MLLSALDPAGKAVPATVENIADAVIHARFVGTDQASDGVVLMKILQVVALNFYNCPVIVMYTVHDSEDRDV
jgi:hypothetical protein